MRRGLRRLGLGALAPLGLIQLVPSGRAPTNPPGGREPPWDRPETRALAVRACFDCHSYESRWPGYAHVAPVSWWIQRDVDDGRRRVNFSAWDPLQEGRPSRRRRRAKGRCRRGAPHGAA